jgi:hypothetical protein
MRLRAAWLDRSQGRGAIFDRLRGVEQQVFADGRAILS